ncbi:MAG: hypothetical protein JWP00_173 [Chloroflexi bacterium]|nr:hypothetical protein [Chloroflexota bacterium]
MKNLKTGGLALVFSLMLMLAGLLGACGDLTATGPNEAARTTIEGPRRTATAVVAATTAVSVSEPSLTAEYPEKTLIRSFTDLSGRKIKLVYGRGNGRGGDYGWAHIYGKHVKGIWYDGGTISTFPQDAGTKTPHEVVNLIEKSLGDPKPDKTGNDRLSYSYQIPGRNKDVFTVVGNDGTIITSYPVNHGSKNIDN